MKRLLFVMIICVLLALACSNVSYPDTIKTAIVQTQTAYPTATSTLTPTFTPQPTDTPLPTDTPQPTLTPATSESGGAQAGAPSKSMEELIQRLKNDTVIKSDTEGSTYKIADAEMDTNQTGVIIAKPSGRSPKNFVISADVSWTTDGGKSDWPMTGPVVLFHQNEQNYYAVHVGLGTGTFKLLRASDGILKRLTKGPITELPIPEGKAQIVVVINQTLVKTYIDGKDVFTANYTGFLSPGWDAGEVSLGMVSGNTSGYGVRIKMENIEIWEIK
jgi:hypothetical protein